MTGTSPIHWSDVMPARRPDGPAPTKEHMAARFAAMALAHSNAYNDAITIGEQTREALRAAIDAHYHPMFAAFAAAAALHGWKPGDIEAAVEGGADVHEWTRQWLTEAGAAEANIARITWSLNTDDLAETPA